MPACQEGWGMDQMRAETQEERRMQTGLKARDAGWRVLLGVQHCILTYRPPPQLIKVDANQGKARNKGGAGQSQSPGYWRPATSVCGHGKVWNPDLEDSPIGMRG